MGVFPTAPHTPLAIQLTRRRNHYSALRIIFNTTPSNSKKMKSPFCCPPPPIIIYNYILQLLHTHIHPGAPHDYQLTNTTEEKRCTDSFPWFDWRPGHSIKRGQATHLPSSKKKSLSKALLAFKFRQIDTFSKDLNPPTIRQVSLRKDDKKGVLGVFETLW